jgi:glycosyltransferase involved in cell wall biosynthesis
MRIIVTNRYREIVGGVESYLHTVVPGLAAAGHEIAFFSEHDSSCRLISLPEDAPVWCGGGAHALDAARAWRPDVIYAHGLDDVSLEAKLVDLAPVIFFAHDYYGACVSGSKTFSFPATQLCNRSFGSACLLRYYPRRCGGLNPLTMWRLYVRSSRRLDVLRHCKLILTASEHMRAEYVGLGFRDEELATVRSPIVKLADAASENARPFQEIASSPLVILFSGRMMPLKGGQMLLDALPLLTDMVKRDVRVILAGEGPARPAWERQASSVMRRDPKIKIEFPGWLTGRAYESIICQTHVVAIPSLWPEPFGRVGLEAGLYGVPTAAFGVGGVPEWLRDGFNGHLAPADPPTVYGLAAAIIRVISDRDHYRRLREGARVAALEYTLENHVSELDRIFQMAAR